MRSRFLFLLLLPFESGLTFSVLLHPFLCTSSLSSPSRLVSHASRHPSPTSSIAVATTEPQQVDLTVANPDFTSLKTARVFSLPLARALLLMSALV